MELSLNDLVLRLGAAASIGICIGVNRDLAGKPLGTKTLGLVGLGAAVTTVATIQVAGLAENSDAMSRVVQGLIQGLMAGIGFIGAGVILRDQQAGTVEGATTAATVWVTAALGLACGLGAWTTAVTGTFFALLLLIAVKAVERLTTSNGTSD